MMDDIRATTTPVAFPLTHTILINPYFAECNSDPICVQDRGCVQLVIEFLSTGLCGIPTGETSFVPRKWPEKMISLIKSSQSAPEHCEAV